MDCRDVWIMVSYKIKRKRERKRGATRKKKKKLSPFFLYLKLCFHPFLSFSIDMQG
jgi:hypothetical protein